LHLVNEAYIEAKNLLEKNYKYLVEFSDELKKNIIVGKDNPIVLQILNETQI